MIKVLIADDERFTRQGILDMVDWDNLNVSEVKEAYDGINALEILKDFEPNILLTDVRMPRLNGIDLAFKTRELYPNCMILFMSGYSDKEYLKSAIKLKAINYVEKPIEIEELEENLNNAILELVKNTTIHNSIEHTIANEISSIDNSAAVKSIISSYFPKDFNDKLVDGHYVSAVSYTHLRAHETEAEWEYAARGKNQNEFPWDNADVKNGDGCFYANFKPDRGNYTKDGNLITSKVAIYSPNSNGLYDMAGNVAEWTSTVYTEAGVDAMSDFNPTLQYNAAIEDPYRLKKKSVRGGSWKDPESFIRSAWRTFEYQNQPRSYIGFRCVRSLATTASGKQKPLKNKNRR